MAEVREVRVAAALAILAVAILREVPVIREAARNKLRLISQTWQYLD